MKQSLFDLTEEMLELDELLSGFDGDITDEETEERIDALFDLVSHNKDAFSQKVDSYIYLMAEMDYRADGRKAEADRLAELAKRDRGNKERLTDRLYVIFKRLGYTEFKTRLHDLRIGNVGGQLALELDLSDYTFDRKADPARLQLPKKYIVNKPEIDKDAIKADLDAGKTLPFARYAERKEKLKIK